MKMNFHGYGMVSKEEIPVCYKNERYVVLGYIGEIDEEDYLNLDKTRHEDEGGCDYWIFDLTTGKCLNDLTTFGCHRSIDVKIK